MLLRRAAPALLTLLLCACPAPRTRETPRPAPPSDGWLELTLRDAAIPADPVSLDGDGAAEAPACRIQVDLDGRRVLSEELRPEGGAPPFRVASTWRVSAAPGDYTADVVYAGCRATRGQLDSSEAAIAVSVRAGRVTRLHFDGATLTARTPEAP